MKSADILKHVPGTAPRRQFLAEQAIRLWSEDSVRHYEVPLTSGPTSEESQQLIAERLDGDALIPDLDVAEARISVREAIEEGPAYKQGRLFINYDEYGSPHILYL